VKILFTKIIYNFFFLLHLLSGKILLFKIIEQFEKKSYINKKILSQETYFFIPNQIIAWRVKNLFTQEPETIEWINNFDSNLSIFWDIGGNIGLYSIYSAIKHKNLQIYCFEPSTSNLRTLSRNISINNLESRININQFALSDKQNIYQTMHETHFIEGHSMSTFSYNTDFEGKNLIPEQKYNIYGRTIDYLIEAKILKCPNYIKLDVDGIEHKILNGAKKTLMNKDLSSILVEVNENFYDQHEIIVKIMKDTNFTLASKNQNISDVQNTKFSKTYNYIYNR
jgi:FkbM family methyltransferase